MNDLDLIKVKKAIKGDDNSFTELISSRKEKMYRIAYSYVKNKEDALDVIQESVYKAYISIKKLKKKEQFDSWLIRIVINNSINLIRANKKSVNLEIEIEDSKQGKYTIDEKLDLHSALNSLDNKYKEVIVLKYFESLKFKEIASILDIPVNTVKTNFYRGLDKLKIDLKEGYINE